MLQILNLTTCAKAFSPNQVIRSHVQVTRSLVGGRCPPWEHILHGGLGVGLVSGFLSQGVECFLPTHATPHPPPTAARDVTVAAAPGPLFIPRAEARGRGQKASGAHLTPPLTCLLAGLGPWGCWRNVPLGRAATNSAEAGASAPFHQEAGVTVSKGGRRAQAQNLPCPGYTKAPQDRSQHCPPSQPELQPSSSSRGNPVSRRDLTLKTVQARNKSNGKPAWK